MQKQKKTQFLYFNILNCPISFLPYFIIIRVVHLKIDSPSCDFYFFSADNVVSDMETLRDNTGQLMLFYVQRCLDPPETLTRKTWRSVGLALNVNPGVLDLIEADYKAGRSPTESLLNVLKTFENEPKLTEFVQALILCERHDVAQYINNCPWS